MNLDRLKKRGELINYGVQGPLGRRYDKPPDKYPHTNPLQDLETDFNMASGVTSLADLGEDFDEEAGSNEDYLLTPTKAN